MLLKVYKSRVWILLLILLPFIGKAQIPGLPPGWEFTLNPTSAIYSIPASVTFNAVDTLQVGDWIGVFYEDNGDLRCGGANQWIGTGNSTLIAFGNDDLNPVKNGFADGELIQWKFFYSASVEELCVKAYDDLVAEFSWNNGNLGAVSSFWSCAATLIFGTVEDSYGFAIPVTDMYIYAHPWCFLSDTLSTTNGGIVYYVEDGIGNYILDCSVFGNPVFPGDLVSMFFINTSQTDFPDFSQKTINRPPDPINPNPKPNPVILAKNRTINYPRPPCTWHFVDIPAGKTAKFEFFDVNACGNINVARQTTTMFTYEDYLIWNWNKNKIRQITNNGSEKMTVRLHNNNRDWRGFSVKVTYENARMQTSPDNREEFAVFALGGGDGFSCEFGDIVASNYIYNYEQGALLSDFPSTLGPSGVEYLTINFESYDNIWWDDMELMIRLLNISEPATLHLVIPDATIPQTSVNIFPGDTVCYLYPGGIPIASMHTMSLYLDETSNFPITIDAFNFSSNIPIQCEVICPESFAVCLNNEPWQLYGATPEDGVYTGVGVINGLFDPEVAGVGEHVITYTYDCDNGLEATCEFTITVIGLPIVFAGNDATISEEATYTLDASATNYGSPLWTTTGDGVFDNVTILHPTYTPGPGDIVNSTVELCLTAYPNNPCTTSATDCMVLTLIPEASTLIYGTVTNELGEPQPVNNLQIIAFPLCNPDDTLNTNYGTIAYWIEDGIGYFEFDCNSFLNPPTEGAPIFINFSNTETLEFASEEFEVNTAKAAPLSVVVGLTTIDTMGGGSGSGLTPINCASYLIQPYKTLCFKFLHTNGCGNITVDLLNQGGKWQRLREWGFNTYGDIKYVYNPTMELMTIRLVTAWHGTNYDFCSSISFKDDYTQTSPSNHVEKAQVNLRTVDRFSCEFGNITTTFHFFEYAEGAFLEDFPQTLGNDGVQQLDIQFESYDNMYWSNMELLIKLLNVTQGGWLNISIPDATIPITSVFIEPGQEEVRLNLGGINAPGFHTMTLQSDGALQFDFDYFKYISVIPPPYHIKGTIENELGEPVPEGQIEVIAHSWCDLGQTLSTDNGTIAYWIEDGVGRYEIWYMNFLTRPGIGDLIHVHFRNTATNEFAEEVIEITSVETPVIENVVLKPAIPVTLESVSTFTTVVVPANSSLKLQFKFPLTNNEYCGNIGLYEWKNGEWEYLYSYCWNKLGTELVVSNEKDYPIHIKIHNDSNGIIKLDLVLDFELFPTSPVNPGNYAIVNFGWRDGHSCEFGDIQSLLHTFYYTDGVSLSDFPQTMGSAGVEQLDIVFESNSNIFWSDMNLLIDLIHLTQEGLLNITLDGILLETVYVGQGISQLSVNLGGVSQPGEHTLTLSTDGALEFSFDCFNYHSSFIPSAVQDIDIIEGWSIISSFIEPYIPGMADIFSVVYVQNQFEVMLGKNGIFWPSGSINTIGDWDVYEGYKVKMKETGQIILVGEIPKDKTINLDAGANYIPVLSQDFYPAMDIFTQLGDGLIFAFDLNTELLYWPQGDIYSLDVLEPGKGYLVGMTQPGQATYSPMKVNIQNHKPARPKVYENAPLSVTKSGSTHFVSINHSALGELEFGDYIGVFNNEGVCSGFTQVDKAAGNILLVAYGNDFTVKANTGLADGENMAFRIFRTATGAETSALVSFDASMPNTEFYTENGQSKIVHIKTGATSIVESDVHKIHIYPNPNDGTFTIEGINEKINVRIFNAFGGEVYFDELNLPAKVDLSTQPKGIYFVSVETGNAVFFEKLVIN